MARCIRSDTMNGCLKGALKLGCAIAIIGVLALIWWFREPIMRTGARWFGRSTALPSVADTAVGAPTPKATASGQAKVGNLRTSAGPDSVVLTPNEMASLIGAGIDWNVRKMYDSLRVELQEGKLILHARDRKSTRLNSSHSQISYAVFCLKKKKKKKKQQIRINIHKNYTQ